MCHSSSELGLGETLTGSVSGRQLQKKGLSCFFALLSVLSFKENRFSAREKRVEETLTGGPTGNS